MRRPLKHFVLIAVVGLIAYANTFHVPFQFDDYGNISENPVVQRIGNFIGSAQGFHYNPRRFIGYLTFALNYALGGLDVVGYHIVNIAIHITTAFLIYLMVMLTFRTPYFRDGGRWTTDAGEHDPSASGHLIALFSALLFVAHPVQTEAVTYIVQRLTSLAALFYLLSIVLYLEARLIAEKAKAGERGFTGTGLPEETGAAAFRLSSGHTTHVLLSVAFFALSFLSAVLAMLTKEISFTLPIMIVLYEFTFFKSPLRRKLFFLLPAVVTIVIIPLSILGVHKPLGEIISDLSMKTRVQSSLPRWDYLLTELKVVTVYIRLLFFPVNQNLDYDYPVAHSLTEAPVLLSLLFLAAVFGMAVYFFRRSGEAARRRGLQAGDRQGDMSDDSRFTLRLLRLAGFGIFWFFIALSVESSLIPIADVMFEHRVYLPSAGAFLAITSVVYIALTKAFHEKQTAARIFTVFFSTVTIVLCMATLERNAVWRSELSLWTDVVKKSPANARAYNNIGYFFLEQGRTGEALGYFRRAIRLSPGYADAQDNAGVALYEEGLFDDAMEQFMRAVFLMPGVSEFHHNLGLAYVQKGRLDEALAEFGTALKLSPGNPEIYNDMGVIYRRQGDIGKAVESFRRALKLNPNDAGAHYNLGLAYKSMGLQEKAAEHLNRAHLLDPGRF
jgi:Flp pilus assembly protein TadD